MKALGSTISAEKENINTNKRQHVTVSIQNNRNIPYFKITYLDNNEHILNYESFSKLNTSDYKHVRNNNSIEYFYSFRDANGSLITCVKLTPSKVKQWWKSNGTTLHKHTLHNDINGCNIITTNMVLTDDFNILNIETNKDLHITKKELDLLTKTFVESKVYNSLQRDKIKYINDMEKYSVLKDVLYVEKKINDVLAEHKHILLKETVLAFIQKVTFDKQNLINKGVSNDIIAIITYLQNSTRENIDIFFNNFNTQNTLSLLEAISVQYSSDKGFTYLVPKDTDIKIKLMQSTVIDKYRFSEQYLKIKPVFPTQSTTVHRKFAILATRLIKNELGYNVSFAQEID